MSESAYIAVLYTLTTRSLLGIILDIIDAMYIEVNLVARWVKVSNFQY